MTPATDPHGSFRQRMALHAAAAAVPVLAAAAWAWLTPPPAGAPASGAAATVTRNARPGIDPAAWNVTLWRPFQDEAPAAVAAAPAAFRLYSIMQQGDGLIAAISTGENAGMTYVRAGDSGNGYTVVRIEADAVVLRINGQTQRLGLGP